MLRAFSLNITLEDDNSRVLSEMAGWYNARSEVLGSLPLAFR